MTSKEIKRAVSACQGSQTHCALCHERLKGQWKQELQQFLQRTQLSLWNRVFAGLITLQYDTYKIKL